MRSKALSLLGVAGLALWLMAQTYDTSGRMLSLSFQGTSPWVDNVTQLAGTAVDVNSGAKSAGTLRVVVATDQPQLTNKLLVTPDSVALPANQSVNVAQFGATNVVTGAGAGGAGIPRVTVSNDSSVKVWDGTTTAAVIAGTTALKTDLSSVAGTATVTSAAGVQKVGIVGNANAALDAANNATAPANVLRAGGQLQTGAQATAGTAGQLGDFVGALDHVQYARLGGPVPWSCSLDNIAATLTQCKAATGAGIKAYVTDIVIASTTATAGQFLVRTGTGTNCATGTASLFPSAATVVRFPYPGNTSTVGSTTIHLLTPLSPPAASAICIICIATQTCTVQMQGYEAP